MSCVYIALTYIHILYIVFDIIVISTGLSQLVFETCNSALLIEGVAVQKQEGSNEICYGDALWEM